MTTKPTSTYGVPQVVRTPIEIPGLLRSGLYRDILVKASALEATSKEKGLAPHMRIPFASAADTKKFLTGLGAARRRARAHASDADILTVRFMRVTDNSKHKFEVYVWNEEGGAEAGSRKRKK